ncbi:MAG: hypothetical protein HS111_20975 [Kofleriaceae bacterium]|nr:hypothetical protein [Kofleriaceae bacterium]
MKPRKSHFPRRRPSRSGAGSGTWSSTRRDPRHRSPPSTTRPTALRGHRLALAVHRRSAVTPVRALSPRVAARNLWLRIEALRRNRAFLDAYRAARALWLAGLDVVFPDGTYWLHCFAGVPVAPLVRS